MDTMQMTKSEFPVPLGRHTISPSRIKTARCPRRYALLYGQGGVASEPATQELMIGSLLHTVASGYWLEVSRSGEPTRQGKLEELLASVWESRPASIDADEWPEYARMGRQFLNVLLDPRAILGVEMGLAIAESGEILPEADFHSDRAWWGGVVDLALLDKSGMLTAYDWTTGSLGGQIQSSKSFQLAQYAWGLSCWATAFDAGWDPNAGVKTVIYSLRTGASHIEEHFPQDLDETRNRIAIEHARAKRIIDDPLSADSPEAGAECSICLLECPLVAEMANRGVPARVVDDDEALEVLGDVLALDRKRRDFNKVLRGFLGSGRRLDLNGKSAWYRPTKERVWNMKALVETLEAFEIELDEALRVDSRGLARAMKARGLDAEVLDGLFEERTIERWGVYSTSAEDADE